MQMTKTNKKNVETTIRVLALSKFIGITPRMFESLLFHFETLERILRADSGKLMAIDGMSAEYANKINRSASYFKKAETYLKELNKKEIKVVSRLDADYPQSLFELNDPPLILYYRGKLPDNNRKKVTISGTEEASQQGISLTVKLAGMFAKEKIQIISSLKKGIDASVHVGCGTAGGESFAVLDRGFNHLTSDEDIILADDIVLRGGLITEHPPEDKGLITSYIYANRLISALSHAVIITEVYDKSKRILDLLKCCNQIGKLIFLQIDPKNGALTEEKSLNEIVRQGAIPMVGMDKVDDIIKSLV